MRLDALDWTIVVAYLVLSGVIGVVFTRRAGSGAEGFFLSGRALPWWVAGTSMVATTFAADTPLAVTGLVARHGLAGNWLWWNMVMSGVLTTFFFARLWRRAEVLTDAELIELRYSGRAAAVLRVFRALYMALPVNLIVIGWVNLAMKKILQESLGLQGWSAVWVMCGLTAAYSMLSGLWGVVVTDLFQFVLAMAGCILLAFFAVDAVGGLDALVVKASAAFGSEAAVRSLVPPRDAAWLPWTAFLAYLTVQWWATSYPGSEPGGGGYIAQRIFSARSERDGLLASLWFNIAHYTIRPWPWILTALAVVVLYPGLDDPASGYVRAGVDLLPSGLRGLMLAAFGAAYMSTISTQLNWGASYLVNDVYRRHLRPGAEEKELARVGRGTTMLVFGLSLGSTYLLEAVGSVDAAWRLLIALGAGTGPVLMLRWYWWRVSAFSELFAMGSSLLCFVALTAGGVLDPADPLQSVYLMLATTASATVAWVLATFLLPGTDRATLERFLRKVRPGGPGWRAIGPPQPIEGGSLGWTNWLAGVVAVYASLFGVGRLLLGPRWQGAAYLLLAAAAFAWIAWRLRERDPGHDPQKKEETPPARRASP